MSHRLIIRTLTAPITEDEHTHEPGRITVAHVIYGVAILSTIFGLLLGLTVTA